MGLPAPARLPLFTALTLIDRDLLGALLERPMLGVPAELPGFALASLGSLADDGPRVLVPSGEHSTPGILYEGITSEDWRRLDAYQGVGEGLYERTHAEVRTGRERRLWAFVYLPSAKLLTKH